MLGIVYRYLATHLIKKAGSSRRTAQTGAVTLIRRFQQFVARQAAPRGAAGVRFYLAPV